MRPSTKRILSIALAGFFLIASLFVYGRFIRGYVQEVNEKRAELFSKQDLFKNQNNAIRQVQDTVSSFQNFQDIQKKINLAIPSGINTISAIRQIEAVAARSSVNIISLNFKTIAQRPSREVFLKKIGVLQVEITVGGNYDGIKNFVKLFETNARIANVQEFDFKPKNDSPSALTLKVEMYYQDQ